MNPPIARTVLNRIRSYQSTTTFLAALVIIGVLTAGFMFMSGHAQGLTSHLPASLTGIFASRTTAHTAPAAAPRASSAPVMQPFAPLAGTSLLVEDFNYTAATLLTANNWSAHSGAGTNAIAVVTPGLTYAGYPSSGVGNAVSMTTSGEDDNKTFTSQTSGSVYAAAMVNVSATQTTGDYFVSLFQTSAILVGRVFAKKDPSSTNYALGIARNSTTVNYTGFTFVPGSTHLIVVKYTFIAGLTNDTVDLFIDPVLGEVEPAPTVSATDVTATDATALVAVALRQGAAGSASTQKVDGIRVGTSWESATAPLYATTAVALSANTTITPGATPTTATSINVSTNSKFKGVLIADPATGVVRVTNANPAGSYPVTVKAFGPGGSTTASFILNVTTPASCTGAVAFSSAADVGSGAVNTLATGDFDNDGKQDLAYSEVSSSTVKVRLGNGDGTFGSGLQAPSRTAIPPLTPSPLPVIKSCLPSPLKSPTITCNGGTSNDTLTCDDQLHRRRRQRCRDYRCRVGLCNHHHRQCDRR